MSTEVTVEFGIDYQKRKGAHWQPLNRHNTIHSLERAERDLARHVADSRNLSGKYRIATRTVTPWEPIE